MASKTFGLVPQAVIVAACYVVVLAASLAMPPAWIPAEMRASKGETAWNVLKSVVVAAVVVAAVNCSVVGGCHNLAWAYAAYSVATLVLSFLMLWFLSSIWRQMTPEDKASMKSDLKMTQK